MIKAELKKISINRSIHTSKCIYIHTSTGINMHAYKDGSINESVRMRMCSAS